MAAAIKLRSRYDNTPGYLEKRHPAGVLLRSQLAVAEFLDEIDDQYAAAGDGGPGVGWLLRFRSDFRAMIQDGLLAAYGLGKCLQTGPTHTPAYAVAIFLLGRCASRSHTLGLSRLDAESTPAVRKHYARALRRVEAWPRLRRLSEDHPDDRFVQAVLENTTRRPFVNRLSRFAQHVDHSHEAEAALVSRMPLWIRDTEWNGKPPKRASWIRIVLERIREWVRGE
ncbi:hypothetical protein [Aeoliella sp.]|uniref:hypothetical protein n=1 Tax=Aeoliella sp. TaxID=2795800 RepID=UPI003CCC1613